MQRARAQAKGDRRAPFSLRESSLIPKEDRIHVPLRPSPTLPRGPPTGEAQQPARVRSVRVAVVVRPLSDDVARKLTTYSRSSHPILANMS